MDVIDATIPYQVLIPSDGSPPCIRTWIGNAVFQAMHPSVDWDRLTAESKERFVLVGEAAIKGMKNGEAAWGAWDHQNAKAKRAKKGK